MKIFRNKSYHIDFLGFGILLCFSVLFIGCKKEVSKAEGSSSPLLYLNGGNNDKVQNVEPTKDGGFIYIGYTVVENANTQAFLLKVDANGKQEWYKTYGDQNFDLFNHAIECSDGGFVAVGRRTMLGAGSLSDMDYVVKTDQNGNQVWSKSFTNGSGALCELSNVVETDDHALFATGSYPSNRTWMCVFFLKFDLNGNMQMLTGIEALPSYKPNRFNAQHQNQRAGGMDISVDKSGRLMIGADVALYDVGKGVPALLSVNPNGVVNYYYPYLEYSSSTSYSPPNFSPTIKTISTEDGYYLCWNSDSFKTSGPGNAVNLLKTDLDGKPVWLKKYGGISNAVAFDIQKSLDGTLYIVGCTSTYPINNLFPEGFKTAKAWVLKLDSNGSILLEEQTGGKNNVNIYKSVNIRKDGSVALAGISSLNLLGYHKAFFTTLNSMK